MYMNDQHYSHSTLFPMIINISHEKIKCKDAKLPPSFPQNMIFEKSQKDYILQSD